MFAKYHWEVCNFVVVMFSNPFHFQTKTFNLEVMTNAHTTGVCYKDSVFPAACEPCADPGGEMRGGGAG